MQIYPGGLLGPVVQSIISLTKSFVNDLLSSLVRIKPIAVIFLAKEIERSFCTAKASHIFWQRSGSVFAYLTSHSNNVVSFEQLDPGFTAT